MKTARFVSPFALFHALFVRFRVFSDRFRRFLTLFRIYETRYLGFFLEKEAETPDFQWKNPSKTTLKSSFVFIFCHVSTEKWSDARSCVNPHQKNTRLSSRWHTFTGSQRQGENRSQHYPYENLQRHQSHGDSTELNFIKQSGKHYLKLIYASITAMIPLRKIPSKVPAPPMLATGAPRRGITWRFVKSAPINVPKTPAT